MRRYGRSGLVVAAMLGLTATSTAAQTAAPEPPARMATAEPSSERAELRDLLAVSREIAKSTREGVDYGRVVPDLLTQILAKLDKVEDKLDRIDAKLGGAKSRGR